MKTKQQEPEIKIQDVPLQLIDVEGQSVREAMDNDHVVELAMSISKHGLLEPIILQPGEDGRYQLLAGFHRLTAFHRLGRTTIPAHIRSNLTGSVKTIALIENIIRRDMSLAEEVAAVAHMSQEENLSTSSICDLLGKSTEWVNRRLMIPNLPEDVRADLMTGAISLKHAEIIGSIKDDTVRAIVLNTTIQNKLNTRQASDLARLYMETPTMESAIAQGLQKAQEIQTQKTPTRSCDYCGQLTELSKIMFVATCPHCLEILNDCIKNLNTPEVKDNGD